MNTFQLLNLESALKALREVKQPLMHMGSPDDGSIFEGTQNWLERIEGLEREMEAVFNFHNSQ